MDSIGTPPPIMTIPDHLKTLQSGKAIYDFSMIKGNIISQPELRNEDEMQFFMLEETTGREHLMQFSTKLNARMSQPVTFLQATNRSTGAVTNVAWCNHAIDQMEYFTRDVKEQTGGKAAGIFGMATGASVNAMTQTSGRHGGFVNLLLLPLWLGMLALSAVTGAIGALLGRNNKVRADDILERASQIFQDGSSLNVPVYTRPKSYWKWVWIALAIFIFAPLITAPIGILMAYLGQ